MVDGTQKRRWWRKKRWIAAAALAFAFTVLYPASVGVIAYGVGRGAVSEDTEIVLAETVYLPLVSAVQAADEVPQLRGLSDRFDDWYSDLYDLGDRHREPLPPRVVPVSAVVDTTSDKVEFVGVDFDFNAQDTVRPASGTE